MTTNPDHAQDLPPDDPQDPAPLPDLPAAAGAGPEAAPTSGARLTIGDLASRAGVSTATLRTWEARHGFPTPKRLASGHRRYDERDVALVRRVVRQRDAGVRLEVAIADAAGAPATPPPSLFADVRRRCPHLPVRTLRKATLTALTHAMEDECCARAQRPVLFGAFQHERFYRHSEARWAELSRTARDAVVFADFGAAPPIPTSAAPRRSEPRPAEPALPRRVHLPGSSHLLREWILVCDAPDHPVCLAAWELPGQSGHRDAGRRFEALWTLDPREVRQAARACAQLAEAATAGAVRIDPDLLAPTPAEASADLQRATSLFSRLVAYLDREGA